MGYRYTRVCLIYSAPLNIQTKHLIIQPVEVTALLEYLNMALYINEWALIIRTF